MVCSNSLIAIRSSPINRPRYLPLVAWPFHFSVLLARALKNRPIAVGCEFAFVTKTVAHVQHNCPGSPNQMSLLASRQILRIYVAREQSNPLYLTRTAFFPILMRVFKVWASAHCYPSICEGSSQAETAVFRESLQQERFKLTRYRKETVWRHRLPCPQPIA